MKAGGNNDQYEDEYFEHDYEDEEQLFKVLATHKHLLGNMSLVKRIIADSNQQVRLNYQNKREELNFLYESQTKEL